MAPEMERIIIKRGSIFGSPYAERCVRIGSTATIAVAAALTPISLFGAGMTTIQSSRPQQVERAMQAVLPLAPVMTVLPKKVQFTEEDTDGKSFRSINSYYVGRARVEVDWSDVDLAQNVRFMWDRKLRSFDVTPATRKNVDFVVTRYEASPHQTTTIGKFVDHADDLVDAGHAAIDFPSLCGAYSISEERCGIVKALSDKINGKMLIAYGMTELFPSHDGDTNKRVLDMMLRRAGESYLNAIPALGDKYLSMGFYQFTSFAVRHDANGREGANVVSRYSDISIPGSVVMLGNDDQHRAAFYFATYNIMQMVRGLNTRQFSVLKKKRMNAESLTVFMAASHHLPANARRSMAAWLQEGQKQPLRDYLRGNLRIYGKKSASNFDAL